MRRQYFYDFNSAGYVDLKWMSTVDLTFQVKLFYDGEKWSTFTQFVDANEQNIDYVSIGPDIQTAISELFAQLSAVYANTPMTLTLRIG